MKKCLAVAAAGLFLSVSAISAYAQQVTVGELKSKGASVLSAEETKGLLTGATVRYENDQNETQMKLDAAGTLAGTARRRIGGSLGVSFGGEWRVGEDGRWCAKTVAFRGVGGTDFCRTIIKAGDKYYYAGGSAKDETRPAFEMTVSK